MRPFFVVLLAVAALALGCVSRSSQTPMGVQPGYVALVPARIVFLPPFVHPDPSRKAIVDSAAIVGDRVLSALEATVLGAFRDQPEVNGLSPTAFRKLSADRPELLTLLEAKLQGYAKLSNAGAIAGKDGENSCKERSSYIDYYVHCVAVDPAWKAALADVASAAFNADSFLFVVVTDLAKERQGEQYSVSAGVASLLVDANGGKLIWGRQQRDSLASDVSQRTFPEWSALFSRLMSEPFWLDFPGRRQKN